MRYKGISGVCGSWATFVNGLRLVGLLGGIIALTIPCAYGMSGTDHVVAKGQVVREPSTTSVTTRSEDGTTVTTPVNPWPEGTLELINDPLRTDGWRSWFSECPNDIESFDFVVRSAADVNHLIERLAAIKTDWVRVKLKVKETRAPNEDRNSNPYIVTFSIGNQSLINIWYKGLKCDDTGARIFGVNRYTKPPDACPPTLTLVVEEEAVDFNKIQIPACVEVLAEVSEPYRAAHKGSSMLKLFDQLVEEHARKKKTDERNLAKDP